MNSNRSRNPRLKTCFGQKKGRKKQYKIGFSMKFYHFEGRKIYLRMRETKRGLGCKTRNDERHKNGEIQQREMKIFRGRQRKGLFSPILPLSFLAE